MAADDGSNPLVSAARMTPEVSSPGFGLAQPQALQTFGEMNPLNGSPHYLSRSQINKIYSTFLQKKKIKKRGEGRCEIIGKEGPRLKSGYWEGSERAGSKGMR